MKDFDALLNSTGEIGLVEQVLDSVVYVRGLPGAKPEEVVLFETGEFGKVLFLFEDLVEVLLFSRAQVKVGSKVARTNKPVTVAVGEEQLGFVINPLGVPIVFSANYRGPKTQRPVDKDSSGIEDRTPTHLPLETGVAMVDLLVPLGKGQRELVLGDRKTGKTSFLLQVALSQAQKETVCIYGAVGKKRSEIKKIEEFFASKGVMKNVTVVSSTSQDPAGLIYLTPYTAMTLAEYFRDKGRDVLIILDDLTTHAKYCREISLLARRFPGRDSYPVDIFHTQARLLERAGNFKTPDGEASITALPAAETVMGDLSGYIQTNLMSMTDGHIYFDTDLFSRGRRPAINTFLSVTRVGHQAQTPLGREVSRELTSFLSLFEKMQSYIHFGAELNENIKQIISKGERLIVFLDQNYPDIVPYNLQLYLFAIFWSDALLGKETTRLREQADKTIEVYQKDANYRAQVDEFIQKSSSLTGLLANIKTIQF